ncbi:hypothetical protein OCU04_012693 [Sclerotinia nivalis]|uniref:Oxidase ustYa n=1 Tax=Sclerotinia nivalis TaxID=352851 RepID=A0A9X0A983_9HELO|nr:hypothetical protein OCU04_012693 [Sclerotinia nivalis]
MNLSIFQRSPKYSALESEERAKDERAQSRNPEVKKQRKILMISLTVFIAVLVGFFLGRISLKVQNARDLLEPAGDHVETWVYNRTFSDPPSHETESAWRSIFPKGRGFIHHQSLAPNVSGIAVFHELHCLNGIRLAYYAASTKKHEKGDAGNSSHSENSHPGHDDPAHIRHCFDYLRHALMCAADTNLEPVNWKYRGVTGWGFDRTCRNYDAVVAYAEHWRTHSETDIS